MSEVQLAPEPRPLKPRPALLVLSLVVFAIWVAFLTWTYFHQISPASTALP